MKFFSEYRRFRESIQHATHLQEHETYRKAADLLHFLELYVNMATIQMSRLFEDDKELETAFLMTGSEGVGTQISLIKYFGDIHFCIVCLDKVFKLAKELASLLNDARLHAVVRQHYALDEYRRARNALEHMEENITDTDWFRKDFATVIDNTLTLNQVKFKIEAATLEPVYSLYEAIIARLHELIRPNP